MIAELGRIWKKAVVTKVKVLCRQVSGVLRKIKKTLSQDSRSVDRGLNSTPLECEAC